MQVQLNVKLDRVNEKHLAIFQNYLSKSETISINIGEDVFEVHAYEIGMEYDGHFERIIMNGCGVNKKEQEILEAKAAVRTKQKEFKEAQRKLSELTGGKK
jgi:hypothetical protein